MTRWTCPACGSDAVCSRREFVSVYNYRAVIDEETDDLARALREYGVRPRPAETATDVCRRWAEGDDGPTHICVACVTPFARLEVAR